MDLLTSTSTSKEGSPTVEASATMAMTSLLLASEIRNSHVLVIRWFVIGRILDWSVVGICAILGAVSNVKPEYNESSQERLTVALLSEKHIMIERYERDQGRVVM